jgi:hypothetical protein
VEEEKERILALFAGLPLLLVGGDGKERNFEIGLGDLVEIVVESRRVAGLRAVGIVEVWGDFGWGEWREDRQRSFSRFHYELGVDLPQDFIKIRWIFIRVWQFFNEFHQKSKEFHQKSWHFSRVSPKNLEFFPKIFENHWSFTKIREILVNFSQTPQIPSLPLINLPANPHGKNPKF